MVKAGKAGWSKGATGGPNAHHDCRRKREEETDTDRAPPEPVDADAPVGWCRRDRLRGFTYVNSLPPGKWPEPGLVGNGIIPGCGIRFGRAGVVPE